MPQNPPLAIAKYEPLEVASYEPSKDEAPAPAEESSWTLGNVARGLEKSAVGTFVGLGEMVHQIPGVTKAVDALYGTPGLSQQAFTEANEATRARNSGETAGKLAGDVLQYAIPVGEVAGAGRLVAKAPEIIKSGLLGMAQAEGSPVSGALSAGLTAVIPGGPAVKRAAGALEQSAEKSMAQALGATKEWAKDEAAKLAPEMLERGVGGTRTAMLGRAKSASSDVGQRLRQLYTDAAANGKTVSGLVVRGELDLAKDALMITDAAGKKIPMEGAELAIKKLEKMQDFLAKLGDDIPADKAWKIKQVWDKIASKAGLYGRKSLTTATEDANAWTKREGASAFRTLLEDVSPDISKLNKEYQFWSGLRNVLKETTKRTQAQSTGGLFGAIGAGSAGSIGAAASLASGGGFGTTLGTAAVMGYGGRQLVRLVQSPIWRTKVSGPLKQQMADALASGSAGQIASVSGRIIAALPPQLRAQFAQ